MNDVCYSGGNIGLGFVLFCAVMQEGFDRREGLGFRVNVCVCVWLYTAFLFVCLFVFIRLSFICYY